MIAILIALAFAPAFAQDDAADADTVDAGSGGMSQERAEYVRLSQELEKLASRNAWAGVERTYLALVDTGVTPTFEDHLYGAQSARALGDITSARTRLLAANGLREDRTVLDSLWDIDSNYGVVFLACDPGKAELRAEVMPFEPDQAKAVEFAALTILETGVFDGYLPQGKYFFGDTEVKVQPRVQGYRVDMRTDEGMRREKKPKKKKGT